MIKVFWGVAGQRTSIHFAPLEGVAPDFGWRAGAGAPPRTLKCKV